MDLKYLNSHKSCYGCSPTNNSGLKLRFYYDGGAIKAEFSPSRTYAGYEGLVHGGIIACLLDEVMGIAAGYKQDRPCFAAEMNVRFIAPLPINKKVILQGERVADKKKLWLTKGEIKDDAGNIYARAWGKYLPLSANKKAKIEKHLNISLVKPDQLDENESPD
jgi:uncharacterized protein (TIGR00369 family)